MCFRVDRCSGTDRGASAVEYGLLIAAVAAVIVIAVFSLGGIVNDLFDDSCDRIGSKTQSVSC